eukprot:10618008-Alexandrium_andersonii.AAC.1
MAARLFITWTAGTRAATLQQPLPLHNSAVRPTRPGLTTPPGAPISAVVRKKRVGPLKRQPHYPHGTKPQNKHAAKACGAGKGRRHTEPGLHASGEGYGPPKHPPGPAPP